ncbi:MAG: TolC family protein [Gammaproteobacteria bacterium]|nr:TolC family protein [Gammaproteobacteria bacterium]
MWSRQHSDLWSAALVLTTAALFAPPLRAQAPPTPDRPWPIPESFSVRAGEVGESRSPVTKKQYDLVALIDLAERTNPQTRASWEAAREAAAAVGLAESSYLPQLSLEAIGGYEHTPLPAPKDLVPKGYFESNSQEFIPSLALKWLLFDFGRRDAQLQGARADSFVANVAFTGTHQAVMFAVSQAYFDLGAARGRLHAAQKGLSTALTTQDATTAKRNNGLATVVAVAQAERQTAQARYSLAAAEGTERSARANLVATLGIEAATDLDVVDSTELALPATPEQDVKAAITRALTHRPDVIAALGKVDSAEASLKGSRRAYYPVISLAAHAFQNMGAVSSDGKPYSSIDRPGANILLSFSVPIYDGGMRSSQISIARAKVREAEEKLAQVRDSAAQQVVNAYNGLITSLAEYAAANTLSGAAHTAYDAALRSYRQGVGTYTDLATEENAVVQAETQVEDARASAHTAAAALAFAMGTIGSSGSDGP